MGTSRTSDTSTEDQLQAALEAAESPEARYHIRESMQKLHVDRE